MSQDEKSLLLTVARLLRAHMHNHMHHPDFSDIDQDWVDLNEALRPFDSDTSEGADFEAISRAVGT